MSHDPPPQLLANTCPDPLARAPRLVGCGEPPRDRLLPVPAGLEGAVAAIVSRNTCGLPLDDVQRLSHFPASPVVSLSWFKNMDVGQVERSGDAVVWRPFGAAIVLAGSQSQPTVSWAPTTGWGGMVCFTVDAAQRLFETPLAPFHDRFVPAQQAIGAAWWPLFDALAEAQDDAAILAVLQRHLAPRWRALEGGDAMVPALRRLGRQWVERLAWQAHEWRRTHSPRQVERRIKAHSGRSLREWQSLVKTEGAFFSARERHDAGLPVDWAALAQDEGFADQAHLSRATKRITGFTPSEFTQRYAEDESFWVYRLWV